MGNTAALQADRRLNLDLGEMGMLFDESGFDEVLGGYGDDVGLVGGARLLGPGHEDPRHELALGKTLWLKIPHPFQLPFCGSGSKDRIWSIPRGYRRRPPGARWAVAQGQLRNACT